MWKGKFKYAATPLVLISLLLPACAGHQRLEQGLEPVVFLPQLNFELEDFIGEKIWALGFYGDDRFTGDGVGFLVLDFHMLMVDEKLPDHSFARLDGDLPAYDMNGAQILVYGEVKDFAQTYNVFTLLPTSLITVEKYSILTPPQEVTGTAQRLSSSLFAGELFLKTTKVLAQEDAAKGTRAGKCDRALILSGGIDANNKYKRFKNNVIGKHKKLKGLDFTDKQIEVFYGDGRPINVEEKNIVDNKASKPEIQRILGKYKGDMPASCTLVLFVTGHGTGYSERQGYYGARPAFSGETGKTYSENTFKIDLKNKVYREDGYVNPKTGECWRLRKDKKTNVLTLCKLEGGKWVYKGEDKDKDGKISEKETGQDLDGNPRTNIGCSEDDLGSWQYTNNEWDTDRDGTKDVKARWDKTDKKYVVERLKKDGSWGKMGEDTNGDFVIDAKDGGIDWNLDGDRNDQIGFHEGINLWGNEVLWDYELAEMLKPLHERGIHIVVEMAQCFGGGFIPNLRGIVDKIVTFSSENTTHCNRIDTAGKAYAVDEEAFVENLAGIDLESWDKAFEKAKEADNLVWKATGSRPKTKNNHSKWEKPTITTESFFQENNGEYTLRLKIPQDLKDKVYDMEIFFGLQKPRWDKGEVLQLPEGLTKEEIAGGIKIKSTKPFPLTTLEFKIKGARNAESMRIHLTDKEHKNLGYIMPEKIPWPKYTRSPKIKNCAEMLGGTTGWEAYYEGKTLEIPRSKYMEFMINDLNIYITSTDPSVTEEMRECARKLLDFLKHAASETDRQWIADIYMDSYFAGWGRAQGTLPPYLPHPPLLPAENVLSAPVSIKTESIRDESGCRNTLTISYGGRDLTGGDNLVTNVSLVISQVKQFVDESGVVTTLPVTTIVWCEDSGAISTKHYQKSVSLQVGCGETYHISFTATNQDGQTVTTTRTITTAK